MSLTAGTWYTGKVVIDDNDPNTIGGQRLRYWVDTDGDSSFADETELLGGTGAVDDDWSAGAVGLYRGNQSTNVHQFDDFKLGYDNNADGDFDDAGDVIAISDDFNSNTITLGYDDNGNLTDDGIFQYDFDAWNRLRLAKLVVGSDSTTIGDYDYYGDTRRSQKVVTNHGPENTLNDGGNTTVVFYYDDKWRIVETRNGSNQTVQRMLWGTQYTDELLWIEVNGDPTVSNDTNPDNTAAGESGESPADARYAVHQDRNWNVVALSDSAGSVVERYRYNPYGDFVVLAGDSGSGEMANVLSVSTVGGVFAHQGLPMDFEKASYQNRWREYAPGLQQFQQRDPLGDVDGLNLYAYVGSSPSALTDPTGQTIGDLACVACNVLCNFKFDWCNAGCAVRHGQGTGAYFNCLRGCLRDLTRCRHPCDWICLIRHISPI